jgi:hypothetical protein
MEARSIKSSRRLPTRYWRLRFACDIATRLAEYDDEQHDYLYGDRDDRPDSWYWEHETPGQLDALIPELRARIRAAKPFNPLPLSGCSARRDPAQLPVLAPAGIEQRLVAHLDRLYSSSDPTWLLGDEAQVDLVDLEAIAEAHFQGCLDPLLGLVLVRSFWIRPLASWVAPRDGSPRQVIASLAEHLLVEFSAPLWLCCTDAGSPIIATMRWLLWLITLGQGGSLRRLIELARTRWPEQWRPVANKLAAALAKVPNLGSPARGIMFAEILRLGGSTLELRWIELAGFAVDPSAGEVDEAELEFWRQTVAWLVRNRRQLDDESATVILAWARHMQTERQRRAARFDWTGRTFESAERDARAYRQSLVVPGGRWLNWRAKGWDWEGRFAEQDWMIRELRTSEALRAESMAMAHCVRLYDVACWRGCSAIFSVMKGQSRCVTVEIDMVSRRVAQAKRARNAAPSELEHAVIEHWRSTVVDPPG